MRTIIDLFETSVKKFPDNIYLYEHNGESFIGSTYSEVQKKVHALASALKLKNINKGDRIALIAEGCNDWVISELGIIYSGAINVPISIKLTESSDLKFRLEHSECKIIITTQNQLPKIREIKKDLPDLESIIVINGNNLDSDEIHFCNIINEGLEYNKNNDNYASIWQNYNEDDVVNICYTSGTTANPKGIMLSHRNYTANSEQATSVIDLLETDITLLILPWDHSFAHTAGIYTFMRVGASIASVEVGKTSLSTLKNIPKNIKEIKPTQILSVPTLAKNFRKNIEKAISEKKLDKFFNFTLNLAYNYNKEGYNKGGKFYKKLLLKIFDKVIFSKVRENFGGRLKFFIGGGALLDIELQRFFYAIGMPMLQGYGLSEAAPIISANSLKKHKLGSSGIIVDNLEVKILDAEEKELPLGEKGEIVVKGENVMKGYWKNEEETNKTIINGWLHTGDMGYIDNENFLYVLGRFKSLLISDDGEKFSPEGIEEAICEKCSYIDQIMLYNNQNPYTVGLIVPDFAKINKFVQTHKLNLSEESAQIKIIDLIKQDIDLFKKGGEFEDMFPTRWLPSTFAVLGEAFTEENKMINSTMKMVRGKIESFHSLRLEYLYTDEGKDIHNHHNKAIISKFN